MVRCAPTRTGGQHIMLAIPVVITVAAASIAVYMVRWTPDN
jgi:hypothetical protein